MNFIETLVLKNKQNFIEGVFVVDRNWFFEMKFFLVPRGKFFDLLEEITLRGKKNESQKNFSKKNKLLSRLDFLLLFDQCKK